MRLIGLAGFAGSGKDTVARVLTQQHGFSRLTFAEPIKRGLATMFRLPHSLLEDREAKEKPIDWIGHSPRYLMQTLGTEWGRHLVHKDIWLLVAGQLLEQHRRLGSSVVISDVRFHNEAEWIRAQGGEIWHILRPLPQNVSRLHTSEHGVPMLAEVDSTVENDRGLEQLADTVRHALAGECVIGRLTA